MQQLPTLKLSPRKCWIFWAFVGDSTTMTDKPLLPAMITTTLPLPLGLAATMLGARRLFRAGGGSILSGGAEVGAWARRSMTVPGLPCRTSCPIQQLSRTIPSPEP